MPQFRTKCYIFTLFIYLIKENFRSCLSFDRKYLPLSQFRRKISLAIPVSAENFPRYPSFGGKHPALCQFPQKISRALSLPAKNIPRYLFQKISHPVSVSTKMLPVRHWTEIRRAVTAESINRQLPTHFFGAGFHRRHNFRRDFTAESQFWRDGREEGAGAFKLPRCDAR